jgi:hypothetical protein
MEIEVPLISLCAVLFSPYQGERERERERVTIKTTIKTEIDLFIMHTMNILPKKYNCSFVSIQLPTVSLII